MDEELEDGQYECNICYCEYPEKETYSTSCGHKFCYDCFKSYAKEKVDSGTSVIKTRCPKEDCDIYVTFNHFMTLLTLNDYKKYKYYLSKYFVENSDLL